MSPPLIQFKEVHKTLGTTRVLKGVNLTIHRGEITAVIGKSGVGKSVLLKHMIGLMDHDSGKILFEGRALSEMAIGERRELKKKFSYMFQGTALFDSMTVFDNIALPLRETTSQGRTEIRRRVMEKLELLELGEIAKKYPSQLSGGMKKRVALARALVTDPEIVLFDEPTTGLDPIRKNAVHSMIADYQRRFGFTGVVVSHEIPDIFFIAQRVAMIDEGRILFEGSPDMIQRSRDPVVHQFIHGLAHRRDALTGMSTQTRVEKRFNMQMELLERYGRVFSLILLCIENLDEISAGIGHEEGQTALKLFAAAVQRHLRIIDYCSRYGLNEILIMLPETNLNKAAMVCAKLARDLKKSEIGATPISDDFCFNVSAGFAEAKQNQSLEVVLADAESRRNPFYAFSVC